MRPVDKDGRSWSEGDTAITPDGRYLEVTRAYFTQALCGDSGFWPWADLRKPTLERMSISAACGDCVIFDAGGGYPGEQAMAKIHLILGGRYTAVSVRSAGYMSFVTLAECREREFNTCLFSPATFQSPTTMETLREFSAEQKLAAFGAAVLRAHRDAGCPNDVDGGTLQELALRHEILEKRHATTPCGEGCACATEGLLPGGCYFTPDHIKTAIKELS